MYYTVGHNIRKLNGIKWHHFRGPSYSLRSTTMMIRPSDFWDRQPMNHRAPGIYQSAGGKLNWGQYPGDRVYYHPSNKSTKIQCHHAWDSLLTGLQPAIKLCLWGEQDIPLHNQTWENPVSAFHSSWDLWTVLCQSSVAMEMYINWCGLEQQNSLMLMVLWETHCWSHDDFILWPWFCGSFMAP